VTQDGDQLAARLARLDRTKTVVLTHHGRKSGKAYEVRIWFLADGDHVYLATQNMERQWTRNVQANPKVSLRIGNDVLEGEVTPVSDPGEMKRVVELMKKKYPIARPYLWIKKKPDGAFRVRLQG
jgi:deazaflavin-dependent oxidoreductase (nitroreductase family)